MSKKKDDYELKARDFNGVKIYNFEKKQNEYSKLLRNNLVSKDLGIKLTKDDIQKMLDFSRDIT